MQKNNLGKCFSLVNKGQRLKSDSYQTPYSMTDQLLENEKFDYNKTVLEPACGQGAIQRFLKLKFTNEVYGSDVISKNDFLQRDGKYGKYDYIITNPPYKILNEFIVKAKQIAIYKFAFLCKLTHLGGVDRFNSGIFRDEHYPLTKIYLFTRQANIRFTNIEQEARGYLPYRELRADGKYPAGMYYYCWLIWENIEKKYRESELFGNYPVLRWIDNNRYILKRGDV